MAPSDNQVYPLGSKGKIIGRPYQGSHTLYGNWQSDNAIDIATPVGTPVYAVTAGTIGPNIGAFDSSDPHLQGQRLTINGSSNSYYYAHLSQLSVKAGETVQAGQLLGYSGEANGVAHLHFAQEKGNPLNIKGGTPPAGDVGAPTPPGGGSAQPGPTADDLVAQDAQAMAPGPLDPDPNGLVPTTAPDPGPVPSDSWNYLASLPGASPDTLKLAQLSSLQNDAGTTTP